MFFIDNHYKTIYAPVRINRSFFRVTKVTLWWTIDENEVKSNIIICLVAFPICCFSLSKCLNCTINMLWLNQIILGGNRYKSLSDFLSCATPYNSLPIILPSTEIKQKLYHVYLTGIDARNSSRGFFFKLSVSWFCPCIHTKLHVIVVRHAETFTLFICKFCTNENCNKSESQ